MQSVKKYTYIGGQFDGRGMGAGVVRMARSGSFGNSLTVQ